MYIQINYMLIYCYFNKEIYVNWCFVDVMKIHPTNRKMRKEKQENTKMEMADKANNIIKTRQLYTIEYRVTKIIP